MWSVVESHLTRNEAPGSIFNAKMGVAYVGTLASLASQ